MLQAPETVDASARSGPTIHTAPNAEHTVPRLLKDWLDATLPPPKLGYGRRQAMLNLFGRRVTRGAVRHWLNGRRQCPAWVLETIATAIDAKLAALEHARALLAAELERRAKP